MFSSSSSKKGQGLVEYALLAALVIMGLIAVLSAFGPEIRTIITNLTGELGFSVHNGVAILPGVGPTFTPQVPIATSTPITPQVPIATFTPIPTSTPTTTSTSTVTYTPTATFTQTATSTPTATSTSTATSTPTATSTSTATPTATPMGTWITCANENGFCSFSGTTQVRYGANDTWAIQTRTDGVACTNAVFGDPVYGVAKVCQYYQITVATSTPVPTWKTCANENAFCSFSGTAPVRYGANGIWITQTHINGVSCTNAVFGDPISGVAKTCQDYQ